MDNKQLQDLKNRLAALPGLQDRLDSLRGRIHEAESEVKQLLRRLEDETKDVEQLQKESFSVMLLKLVNRYEGRLNRESEEALTAKREYDKAVEKSRTLSREYNELGARVGALRREKELYEAEMLGREEAVKKSAGGEAYEEYKKLEAERDTLARRLAEIEEAVAAANRVRATADVAVRNLESAEDWATYDVWVKGGIFSHMAKYEHIDNAEECFGRLSYQLKELQKELKDVNALEAPDVTFIDSTTRAVDFWFDNIFTDLNVRDKIRGDMYELDKLDVQISRIIDKLNADSAEIGRQLDGLERKKNDLLASL